MTRFGGLFYEIPLQRLSDQPLIWYRWETHWINGYPNEEVPLAPPLDEFEPFDAERYQPLAEVTDAHVAYLRRMKKAEKRPLLFVHIPHVLVAGSINIGGLRVVRWDKTPEAE